MSAGGATPAREVIVATVSHWHEVHFGRREPRYGHEMEADAIIEGLEAAGYRLARDGEVVLARDDGKGAYRPTLDDALLVIGVAGVGQLAGYRIAEAWGIPVKEAIVRMEAMAERGRQIAYGDLDPAAPEPAP